ncbi:DNA repair protein RadC [Skermanella mucosa]|uniref:RadC family protein n=1 Tax=Skermanella mucosa TaxID=1789672 RepID=UPI001E59463B|nr:DNA repair protein RadC [Skermanella mucosa]UEM23569.1 DNA repair protein RadC [Skermanella mucosa]
MTDTEPARTEGALAAGTLEDAGPDHLGHRDRLRTRFLTAGADALQDYELLELLLFAALPRRDVKPLAKSLLRAFGGLWGVLNAPPEALRRQFPKLTDGTIAALTVVGAAALRMTRQEIMDKPVLSTWQRLLDYCQGTMANLPTEQFRLLFLDRKNVLIADEVQQRGTVDHTPVYPREVVKRALELGASAIILVHNHPSGDPTPSRADIEMTKEIARAAAALGMQIHDHLVIGKGKHSSFKAMGLL